MSQPLRFACHERTALLPETLTDLADMLLALTPGLKGSMPIDTSAACGIGKTLNAVAMALCDLAEQQEKAQRQKTPV